MKIFLIVTQVAKFCFWLFVSLLNINFLLKIKKINIIFLHNNQFGIVFFGHLLVKLK
jgi:hypothetical protein